MKKVLLTLLTALFAFAGIAEAHDIRTLQPPKLGDKFYMIRFKDGKSELRVNLDQKDLKKFSKDRKVKEVVETTYAEIDAAVTQQVYTYHYYFSQFVATDKTTDPDGWNAALDRLMSVFSKDMVLFKAINNFPVEVNSWDATRTLFTQIYQFFFQGFTLHTAPDVRVIPICHDKKVQVYVTAGEVDYSRINVNAIPPPQVVTDVGFYDFTLRYESDGVWRFYTWEIDNRIQYVDPPLNSDVFPFTPFVEDPKTHCHY